MFIADKRTILFVNISAFMILLLLVCFVDLSIFISYPYELNVYIVNKPSTIVYIILEPRPGPPAGCFPVISDQPNLQIEVDSKKRFAPHGTTAEISCSSDEYKLYFWKKPEGSSVTVRCLKGSWSKPFYGFACKIDEGCSVRMGLLYLIIYIFRC